MEGTALSPVDSFRALPGLGAEGKVEGRALLIGRARLLEERGIAVRAEDRSGTSVWLAVDGVIAAEILLQDEIRPTAQDAVRLLQRQGMKIVLLTGDQEAPARRVASTLGIPDVIASVLPEGKLEAIRSLRRQGRRVAMVGDGVNDAPALAAADAGLAIGAGSDAARYAASLVLLRPDPVLAARAVELARRTVRVMRENLFWAFAYNAAMIPLVGGRVLALDRLDAQSGTGQRGNVAQFGHGVTQ